MKLAISNIAWPAANDSEMLEFLSTRGYAGLEIAPTRIFPVDPYSQRDAAAKFARDLQANYGMRIASMQSIWFGRSEKIFASPSERGILTSYSHQAVDFAAAVACPTLVFGNPGNRNLPEGTDWRREICFFRDLAAYAHSRGCVFAMEANPIVYDTNFLNHTRDAFAFSQELGEAGFQVTVDFGTILQNSEAVSELRGFVPFIRHVHVSEPFLAPVQRRACHGELLRMLMDEGYDGYISIEMKYPGKLELVKNAVDYLGETAYGI